MKKFYVILTLLVGTFAVAQDDYEQFVEFKNNLEGDYRNPEESILTKKELAVFKGLPFFEYNADFVVEATFTPINDGELIKFATSTAREAIYKRYGKLSFTLRGESFELTVFQSPTRDENSEYKDHLFLPFTDLTNGNTSYGAGRYMDLTMPLPETFTLNFNKTYNPYCAYSYNYSCPYPPMENHLEIAVEAGIKAGLITD